MKISKVYVSLSIQYAADAIGKIADLVDRDEIDKGLLEAKISVAKIALDRALQSLNGIPMSEEKG